MTTFQHGPLTIRNYRPGDEARILATGNLVGRRPGSGPFVARDLAFWRWQFLANPAGTQVLLAVDADGTVASSYCGMPQTVDTPFGQARFVHVVDSMTHPAYRRGLQREGLLAQLGSAFCADYRQHGAELSYGLPVRSVERLGNRLLHYHLLRPVDYLVRPTSDGVPAAPSAVQVEVVDHFPVDVDALWNRCRNADTCQLRRDHRYLHWRYVQNPERDRYTLVLARRAERLCGLMVLRPRDGLVPEACAIVDWVCHDADQDAARALLTVACRLASAHRRRQLVAWFADHDPAAVQLRAIGAATVSSARWQERRLSYRLTGPHADAALLGERWRYAIGDTDLG
jgi:hypothetical protein